MMTDEEMLKWIREGMQNAIEHGILSHELAFVFLQLKILDKLEEVRCGIIDVEQEVAKLNPLYKE
jgi:hypothetical protein